MFAFAEASKYAELTARVSVRSSRQRAFKVTEKISLEIARRQLSGKRR
jgi:hypothetical protein